MICKILQLSLRREKRLNKLLKRFSNQPMATAENGGSSEQLYIRIEVDKTPYTIVKEGQAEVLFPSSHDVFYNPVQEFNRDMSVALIGEYIRGEWRQKRGKDSRRIKTLLCETQDTSSGVRIVEALAASGLRSIRYAKEIQGVGSIVANDMSKQAVESIQRNIKHNRVEDLVTANREDAALFLYKHRQHEDRFDVVDLDPYGSPSLFLDASVQAVKDGGLLLVTCTDMAVLCGNSSETCYSKYGAVSLKSKCCHEMALRIVLQCIESHANRYGRYIVPLLSMSADFYVRIFALVYTSPKMVKQSTSKLAMVYQCVGCDNFTFQPLGNCTQKTNGMRYMPAHGPPVDLKCVHCGGRHQLGGPIWIGPMHDSEFLKSLIETVGAGCYNTQKRMLGVLTVMSEELEDCPLYYGIDRMSSIVHSTTPPVIQFRSALLNAGYKVSYSHACKTSVKTDAPMQVLWDIIRAWVKLNPIKRELPENSPAKVILSQEAKTEVSFTRHKDANPASREKQLLRYQPNPEAHWGPKTRARTSLWSSKSIEKQQRHQGKRKAADSQEVKKQRLDDPS